jgi:hypothetical protein
MLRIIDCLAILHTKRHSIIAKTIKTCRLTYALTTLYSDMLTLTVVYDVIFESKLLLSILKDSFWLWGSRQISQVNI